MNTATVILIGVALLAIIAAIAWGLYKAGFTVDELTAKLGLVEAKMKRTPGPATPPTEPPPAPRTEAAQEATGGARLKNATMKAPADSGAKLSQQAKDAGSSITDSTIELKK
jgi:hypothetical protein